jgi:AraC family transcriptional regulator, alkane utilization regulator
MERLTDLNSADALSEVLRALRVRSTVWCLSQLGAPWAFGVDQRAVASFHLVLEGGGWLEVDAVDGPLRLERGDLVVLPHGNAHAVRDDPETPVVLLDDLLAGIPLESGRLIAGGDGPRSEILCGGFVLEGRAASPLLELLPPIVQVRGPLEWLDATAALVRRELPAHAPGADAVVTRLTDVLLTQAVRRHLSGRDDLDALRDPWIAQAVRLLNDAPERPWTVAELASASALSRSAFQERFREATHQPPMRYLARLRLSRAAELLRESSLPVYEIARRCGYKSDAALNRAFKRALGVPPGRYRQEAREAHELLALSLERPT